MKINLNIEALSGSRRKDGKAPLTNTVVKKHTREIKAALKDNGFNPRNFSVDATKSGTLKVSTKFIAYKEDLKEAEFKKGFKSALVGAGFKAGAVKVAPGPGKTLTVEIKGL